MKLRPLAARKVIKVLTKVGFVIVRKKGSHVILKHPRWTINCGARS